MTTTEFLVSAPGKVIISGEHAVVYGRATVVAALQRRTYVLVSPTSEQVSLHVPLLKINRIWTCDALPLSENDDDHDSIKAFVFLYNRLSSSGILPMKVQVQSELYVGAGLGSSASYAVSLSAALLLAFGHIEDIDKDLETINKYAFELETLFHGKPSGVDNTTSCFGKLRYYSKRQAGEPLPKQQIVDNVEVKICLVNTNVPRSTKTLVSNVRKQYEEFPEILEPVLDSIGAISDQVFHLLKHSREDIEYVYSRLCSLMRYNQKLLEVLGVSHSSIERICALADNCGLNGCKLTGSGGGGCVLVILPPGKDFQPFLNELKHLELEHRIANLGGDGVKLHSDLSDWHALGETK